MIADDEMTSFNLYLYFINNLKNNINKLFYDFI